ncbi:MAG: preprotein translocase subunit SecG [Candidatus Krumholzibacteriia bacterium]|nr:preprotein translocase subunit SecG [bacterium]MCB9513308.1 preprotein translocase subunit SecG [Candidatus Latescibacterota bacterium]MCB9514768.1 preprotein translocase subunit SecG [Candidatus Latescibacterota bacterium]
MYAVLLTLFILVCLVLMVVVLLQSSKGGGLAGAFGGGGSDSSVLGGRSAATFLGKLTVWLAVSFMALALILAVLSSRTRQTASPDGGIISRRQQSGALDVYNVQNDGSILNQIETEGFEGAATEMSGDSTGAAQPGAGTSAPAPAGN